MGPRTKVDNISTKKHREMVIVVEDYDGGTRNGFEDS